MTEHHSGHSNRRHSDRDRERLIDGASDDSPLSDFLDEARSRFASVSPTVANRELTEFVSGSPRVDTVDSSLTSTRRSTMLTQLAAFAGTAAGKAVLATSVAAAAVTGAAATDQLPGQDDPGQLVVAGDDSTSSTVTSTTNTTIDDSTSSSTVDSTSSTSVTTSSTTTPLSIPSDAQRSTVSAGDAGTLVFAVVDGCLVTDSVAPAPGWSWFDEQDEPCEVDVSFRNGDSRVDVDVEFEDGQVRVRVRDRRTDSETFTDIDGNPFVGDDSDDDDRDDDSDSYDDSDDDDRDDDDRDDDDRDDDSSGSDSSGSSDDDSDDDDESDDDESDDD